MKSDFIIRLAAPDNLNEILDIERECFGIDAFSRRQLRYLIGKAKGLFLVAEQSGKIAGYISLLERSHISNLRIYSIAVTPSARGLGIAQTLLERAIEYARTHNLSEISLEVRTDNKAAQALYLKNGFTIHSRLKGYYKDGADAIQMKNSKFYYECN